MSLLELVILLVVAGICGALGQSIAGSTRGGCLTSVVLGLIGAFFGVWIARQLDLPEPIAVDVGEREFPVMWSIVGSAIFVAVLNLIMGRRGR